MKSSFEMGAAKDSLIVKNALDCLRNSHRTSLPALIEALNADDKVGSLVAG